MTLLQITRQLFSKLFIATALILTLNTCKEDTPTEPEGSNGGNNLVSTTIGMNGGELKTEGFSLSVPPGSFMGETKLSLSTIDNFDYLDGNSVSEAFMVEGIPSDFEKTIRIAIKYNEALSDSSFLVMMNTSDNIISADSTYFSNFF